MAVTLQRKQLRQDLGLRRLRETTVGTTGFSVGANGAIAVMDRTYANPDFSGQNLYQRSWMRVASVDYRVASFNAPSGAWVTSQTAINAIASGADFEIHNKLSAAEMDRCIDETIAVLPIRQEVGIPTVEGALFYTLDGAASPNVVRSVLNVYYFANPSGSLDRRRRDFAQEDVVLTATGLELRLPYALAGSQQLVLDALLQVTLSSGDAATVNFPDTRAEQAVLWGAAARCYDLLIAQTPGQESAIYEKRRVEAARVFSRVSSQMMPEIVKKITFETPVTVRPLDDWRWGFS